MAMARTSVIKMFQVFKFFGENNKAIEKGENAFESGHVVDVTWDSDVLAIRGKVHASMKNKLYEVEVAVDKDGVVRRGECQCPVGRVTCHHMAALLFHAHHNISVTDKSCVWKKKVDDSDTRAVTIDELFPDPLKHRSYQATSEPLSATVKDKFFESLNNECGMNVGFSWLLSPEVEESSPNLHKLEETLMSEEFRKCTDKVSFLRERVRLSAEDIERIERGTVGQSANRSWSTTKAFILSASNFHDVLKAINANRRPSPSLLEKLVVQKDLSGVLQVQWGVDHEVEAKRLLEQVTEQKLKRCGIFFHESGLLGASPDAIIDEDELVEIKCPYRWKDVDLEEALKAEKKKYILYFDHQASKWEVNKEHEYYDQIQGQLHLANRENCRLVIYSNKGLLHNIVPRDETWASNIPKLIKFYETELLPYILQFLGISNN